MNKLTKIGVSALCGSLAAVSAANAGDLAVTGGIDMSWTSLEGETTGNPIGIGSNVNFTGSGELDNGVGVALAIAYTNKAAYSALVIYLNSRKKYLGPLNDTPKINILYVIEYIRCKIKLFIIKIFNL